MRREIGAGNLYFRFPRRSGDQLVEFSSELVDAWLDGYTPNYSTAVWMGYPTKRVSMTDVHGEPQQGGYLPAEIWHAYMSSVEEGKTCESFATPKESISYTPFYGKFATTGESRSSEESSEEPSESRPHPETHAHDRGGAGAPSAPLAPEETKAGGTGGASPG